MADFEKGEASLVGTLAPNRSVFGLILVVQGQIEFVLVTCCGTRATHHHETMAWSEKED